MDKKIKQQTILPFRDYSATNCYRESMNKLSMLDLHSFRYLLFLYFFHFTLSSFCRIAVQLFRLKVYLVSGPQTCCVHAPVGEEEEWVGPERVDRSLLQDPHCPRHLTMSHCPPPADLMRVVDVTDLWPPWELRQGIRSSF